MAWARPGADGSRPGSATACRWPAGSWRRGPGVDLADGERGYRLGYAFHAGDLWATELWIKLVAARREPTDAAPEHSLSVESTLSW